MHGHSSKVCACSYEQGPGLQTDCNHTPGAAFSRRGCSCRRACSTVAGTAGLGLPVGAMAEAGCACSCTWYRQLGFLQGFIRPLEEYAMLVVIANNVAMVLMLHEMLHCRPEPVIAAIAV